MKRSVGVFCLACLAALPVRAGEQGGKPQGGVDLAAALEGRTVRSVQGETAVIRGRSPRSDGLYHQYEKMATPLRGNYILSDVLLPTDPWYLWNGKPSPRFDIGKQTPENYHESHNHYQSLLSEVVNATRGANGIPIWGDGLAAAHGANVWGGFFSARSGCYQGDLIGRYLPKDLKRGCGPDFDAQLTGLEVDVLNAGKPGVWPNKAKHGVQVVGFGNPNGQALSIIVENFDREQKFRAGQFESILYAQSSLHPDYGRFIVMDFEQAKIGLDMRKPLFREGAMDFRSEGVGTGIMIATGKSGEIYGGLRWPDHADKSGWLSARLGEGGFRLVSNDNTRELMAVDNQGRIDLSGELYLNGRRVGDASPPDGEIRVSRRSLLVSALLLGLLLLAGNVVLVRYMVRSALQRAQAPAPR